MFAKQQVTRRKEQNHRDIWFRNCSNVYKVSYAIVKEKLITTMTNRKKNKLKTHSSSGGCHSSMEYTVWVFLLKHLETCIWICSNKYKQIQQIALIQTKFPIIISLMCLINIVHTRDYQIFASQLIFWKICWNKVLFLWTEQIKYFRNRTERRNEYGILFIYWEIFWIYIVLNRQKFSRPRISFIWEIFTEMHWKALIFLSVKN